MLKKELLEGSLKLQHAIKESGILSGLAQILEGRGGPEGPSSLTNLLLESVVILLKQRDSFSPATVELVKIFGIEDAFDIQWWSKVMSEFEPGHYFEIRGKLTFVQNHLPGICTMLAPGITEQDFYKKTYSEIDRVSALISVTVPSENHIKITELIKFFESFNNYYEVIRDLEDESKNSDTLLEIYYLESGSDGFFSFAGDKNILKAIGIGLVEIYKRMAFYSALDGSLKIKTISESLPVLERIAELEESGKIEPEAAHILRNKAITAATGLMEVGVLTPDFEGVSAIDPRSIMAPKQKLIEHDLSDASDGGELPSENTSQEFDEIDQMDTSSLSDDEAETLKKLLAKTKENGN